MLHVFLKSNKIPKLALANGLWIGITPKILPKLTMVEKTLITCYCCRTILIKLRCTNKGNTTCQHLRLISHLIVNSKKLNGQEHFQWHTPNCLGTLHPICWGWLSPKCDPTCDDKIVKIHEASWNLQLGPTWCMCNARLCKMLGETWHLLIGSILLHLKCAWLFGKKKTTQKLEVPSSWKYFHVNNDGLLTP